MPAPIKRDAPQARHGADCECCAPGAAAQSLGEVAFDRSACAAASRGDYFAVKSIIARQPGQLHSDGSGGEPSLLEPCERRKEQITEDALRWCAGAKHNEYQKSRMKPLPL